MEFGLLADFVAAIGEGCWIVGGNGTLEGNNLPRCCVAGERGFGADAEELTVIPEARIGGIKENIGFVQAGDANLGMEAGERRLKRGRIGEAELDFNFVGHEERVAEEAAQNMNGGSAARGFRVNMRRWRG